MDSLEAFGVVWGGRRDPEQGTELETDGAGELELKLKRRPKMSTVETRVENSQKQESLGRTLREKTL